MEDGVLIHVTNRTDMEEYWRSCSFSLDLQILDQSLVYDYNNYIIHVGSLLP